MQTEKFQDAVEHAEVIIVDNVADYYITQTEQRADAWGVVDFPNCAPVFPLMWLEARTSKVNWLHAWGALFMSMDLTEVPELHTKIYGNLKDALYLTRETFAEARWYTQVAVMLQQYPNPDTVVPTNLLAHYLVKADGTLVTHRFDEGTDIFAHAEAGEAAIRKDAKGRYILIDSTGSVVDGSRKGFKPEEVLTFNHQLLNPLWMAVSFLHCKNVVTTKTDPCHLHGKKKASIQCARVHYKTLDIHPMREVLKREGASESTGLKYALHICRGHFRDYSQGRGLFGRHKGLYWFEPHFRGSSTYGEVVKDYMIHPT
jgi:hypothetical protein